VVVLLPSPSLQTKDADAYASFVAFYALLFQDKGSDVPKRRGAHTRKTHSSMHSKVIELKRAGLHVRSESALGSLNSIRKYKRSLACVRQSYELPKKTSVLDICDAYDAAIFFCSPVLSAAQTRPAYEGREEIAFLSRSGGDHSRTSSSFL
jgi:hypothetical protein